MTDPKPRLPFIATTPAWRIPRLRLVDTAAPPTPTVTVDTHSSGLAWARRYRTKLRLTDAGVIVAAVATGLVARLGAEGASAADIGQRVEYWGVSLAIIATWIITLGTFHTRDSRVVGVGAAEYKRVINASALAFGLLAIAFLLFQVHSAREYFLFALPLGLAGLTLERWLWRKWLFHQRLFGHYLARVLVVGKREDVEYVIGQVDAKSGAAYCVVGAALESDGGPAVTAGNHEVPVVADLSHAASAAASMGVDSVIVAGAPDGGSQFIRSLAWDLEGTSAELVLSSRLTDVAGPRIHFRPVEGLPLIHVEIPNFDGARHALKRMLDLAASGLALLVLLPLLVAIGALVRLDSPGPALFRQERCGRNGRSFTMVKFRSMVQTAEDDLAGLRDLNEGSGALFKIRHDPRITRVGRVIRKYSLDELPQLWNVFVGEMSLVGPRPPLPTEVECYETHVHRRLYIKPGLTGMWQVNGRSDLSWEESVRLDLFYVENWSLPGDLLILWRTVKVVLRPTGAY
jgi:exopolysaccharide biosynthesis polyprenyl glycosylphosphotransferase